MALRRGLLHSNLLVRGSNCHKFCSFVGVRSFSDKVTTEAETSSVPETTSDHLIYTQEHFALKESLRKVRRTDASSLASIGFTMKTIRFVKLVTLYYILLIHTTVAISMAYCSETFRSDGGWYNGSRWEVSAGLWMLAPMFDVKLNIWTPWIPQWQDVLLTQFGASLVLHKKN